jgi:hypothetical protein
MLPQTVMPKGALFAFGVAVRFDADMLDECSEVSLE